MAGKTFDKYEIQLFNAEGHTHDIQNTRDTSRKATGFARRMLDSFEKTGDAQVAIIYRSECTAADHGTAGSLVGFKVHANALATAAHIAKAKRHAKAFIHAVEAPKSKPRAGKRRI